MYKYMIKSVIICIMLIVGLNLVSPAIAHHNHHLYLYNSLGNAIRLNLGLETLLYCDNDRFEANVDNVGILKKTAGDLRISFFDGDPYFTYSIILPDEDFIYSGRLLDNELDGLVNSLTAGYDEFTLEVDDISLIDFAKMNAVITTYNYFVLYSLSENLENWSINQESVLKILESMDIFWKFQIMYDNPNLHCMYEINNRRRSINLTYYYNDTELESHEFDIHQSYLIPRDNSEVMAGELDIF